MCAYPWMVCVECVRLLVFKKNFPTSLLISTRVRRKCLNTAFLQENAAYLNTANCMHACETFENKTFFYLLIIFQI